MVFAPLSPNTAALLGVIFVTGDRGKAQDLLEVKCGTNLPCLSSLDPVQLERYRFAAIKLSKGSLEALERAIALAQTDWRDLLMEADFAHDTRAHERWFAETLGAARRAL